MTERTLLTAIELGKVTIEGVKDMIESVSHVTDSIQSEDAREVHSSISQLCPITLNRGCGV